jgi:hypothetical protein
MRGSLLRGLPAMMALLFGVGCTWIAGLQDVPTPMSVDAASPGAVEEAPPEEPDAGASQLVKTDAGTPMPVRDASADVVRPDAAVPEFRCATASPRWSGSQYFCQDYVSSTLPGDGFDQTSGNASNLLLSTASGSRALEVRIPSIVGSASEQAELSKSFTLTPTEARAHFTLQALSRAAVASYIADLDLGSSGSSSNSVSLYWRTTGALSATMWVGAQQQSAEISGIGTGVTHVIDMVLRPNSATISVNGVVRASLSVPGSVPLLRARLRLGNVTTYGPNSAPASMFFDNVELEAH